MNRKELKEKLAAQVELLDKLSTKKFLPLRLRIQVFDRLVRLVELMVALSLIDNV